MSRKSCARSVPYCMEGADALPASNLAAPRGGARQLGLRIDACTYQGVRQGVLPLLEALRRRELRATLFPSMGPDRSGLAVLRLIKKRGFLGKMLRTNAASMYGLRTALYGTVLPAPHVARRCGEVLRRAVGEGHEVGIHAWDHVRWQDRLDRLSAAVIRADYEQAVEAFATATGSPPRCTAAPAWLASDASLAALEGFGFRYASDTRGRSPFLPAMSGGSSTVPQVPITLPTLDEVLGLKGATAADFADRVLRDLVPGKGNVLCVHAEAEGRTYLGAFEKLLDRALEQGWRVLPLGELLPPEPGSLPRCAVERGLVEGRAGVVSVQGS